VWQCFERSIQSSSSCKAALRISSLVGVCGIPPHQTSNVLDIRRGVRLGFYGTTDPTAQQLAEEADQTMFREVGTEITMCSITSFQTSSATAIVSGRDHDKITFISFCCRYIYVLTTKTDERNFIVRQLFSNMYWLIHWYSQLFLL